MSDPTTILIGDSHIDQLLPRFAENGFHSFSRLVSLGAKIAHHYCGKITLKIDVLDK